jgi:murein peptide amidase A
MIPEHSAASLRPVHGLVQRLGRNHGQYSGETIELLALEHEIRSHALKHGWQSDCFLQTDHLSLVAYHLVPNEHQSTIPAGRKRVYISAGIHGDEPAGPKAALQLIKDHRWPENLEVWICPCLNPTGLAMNRRENAHGLDLNRQYLSLQAEETRAHVAWLARQPGFDISICMHEDWEAQGFYVYELNPENQPSLAGEIVRSAGEVCPIDQSATIEGREACGGIIRPADTPDSRLDWPEAFYLIRNKTRLSYTMEAPSDFPLELRVAALVHGVRGVLDSLN